MFAGLERSGDGAEENNIRFKRIYVHNVASVAMSIKSAFISHTKFTGDNSHHFVFVDKEKD